MTANMAGSALLTALSAFAFSLYSLSYLALSLLSNGDLFVGLLKLGNSFSQSFSSFDGHLYIYPTKKYKFMGVLIYFD
jgi:hypothetical protein